MLPQDIFVLGTAKSLNSGSIAKGKTAVPASASAATTTESTTPPMTASFKANANDYGSMKRSSVWGGIGGDSPTSLRLQQPRRSAERLQFVSERGDYDVDISDDDGDGMPPTWMTRQAEEGASEDSECEDSWRDTLYYRRTLRLYSLVPLCSLLFCLLAAILPLVIQPKSLPHPPSAMHLALAALLAAALWCLSHSLRVPLYNLLDAIFSALFTRKTGSYSNSHTANRRTYLPAVTALVHAVLYTFIQEAVRLSSLAIFNVHWHQRAREPQDPGGHVHVHVPSTDTAFREVWALALGWAIAEVCAGIVQGYQQLFLYRGACFDADVEYINDLRMYNSINHHLRLNHSGGGDSNGGRGSPNGTFGRPFDEQGEEAMDLLRRSMSWLGTDDGDADDIKLGGMFNRLNVDDALMRLAHVRAREELEELYGEPYITIPVIIPILQRLNSILLSLGITLILSIAYLPPAPFSSEPLPSHRLTLPTSFALLTLIHALLSALHTYPILGRIGLPAAAYISLLVSLALAFGGGGVWAGVW